MSKLRNSIIRRRKKNQDSCDDNDIDNASSFTKLKRSSSFVSREVLLHHAVTQENLNAATKVLEGDVDVNFMRPPGVTPLHIACVAGNLKFVSVLTEKGADITIKTSLGLTPLRLAFIFGHFDVSEYLITLGSDPNDIKDGFQYDIAGSERKQSYSKALDVLKLM